MKLFTDTIFNSRTCVLTGTMVYGPKSENSDIDVVMLQEDVDRLLNDIENVLDYKIHDTLYDGPTIEIKISDYFPIINIIQVESLIELEAWRYATLMLSKMKPFEDRGERLTMFKRFRAASLEKCVDEAFSAPKSKPKSDLLKLVYSDGEVF